MAEAGVLNDAPPARADDLGPGAEIVLKVRGLTVTYPSAGGRSVAVDHVDLDVRRGEVLGVVGESGSGKTSMATAILGLVHPPAQVEAGQVLFEGTDLRALAPEELRRLRWRSLAFIPQGAMNALNPVVRVEKQFFDAMKAHGGGSRGDLRRRVVELLESVELRAEVARMFPHELSGGMKQRVCIALATALGPSVIVADEPTSALDVVVQKSVMETLKKAQESKRLSLVLIGHDMALQAQVVDRLAVMCKGHLVEIGQASAVFGSPAHPYTKLLLSSVPSIASPDWAPSAVDQAVRDEAYAMAEAGRPLRAVGADHEAALP